MPEQDAVGTELAGYRITVLLGRGGMGVVYRARDLALERDVALKLLAPELASDVRFRERFLRESRLAASLDHPSIIPVYDAGEVAGRLYIAMRLVDGSDLKRLLADEGPLDPARALAYLEQIADALDAAHERGLIHRDVKASNVLVDRRGHCYLADFGLSRKLDDISAAPGSARSLGTVSYVAPEQIRGGPVDGRADIYALGCLFYECIAGRPPFAGPSDTAIVFAHLEEPPPTLPPFDEVLAGALAKDPDARYTSGRELIVAARAAAAQARRPHRRLLATIGVLAAAGVALAVATTRHGEAASAHAPTLAVAPNALSVVDQRSPRVRLRVDGTGAASDVAFAGMSAWVSAPGQHRLVAIDLRTHRIAHIVKLPWAQTERMAAGGGTIWVREARNLGRRVYGVDAHSGRITHRLTFGGSSTGITFGDGSLWLVGGANVTRLDPSTKRTLHTIAVAADVLAYGDDAVWAAGTNGDVWKIDPVENRIAAHARLHPTLTDIAVGDGFVWAAVVGDSALFKLSENDLSVQDVYPLRSDPARLAVARSAVWTANTDAATISSIAVRTGRRRTFATGADPTTVASDRSGIWIGSAAALPTLPPVALSLRVSTPFPLLNVDPEQRVFPMDEQLSYTTCSNLLGYPDSSGPRGGQLTPELAASMPAVSADGRVYTFHVRPGIRFSPPSNELVTAQTFAHTIERTMGPRAQRPWDYLGDLVGAQAYERGAAPHIAGITAHGSTLSFRLVHPAGDFLTRLSLPVFCPVPRSTPLVPRLTHMPIPSTGPYYIAAVEPHRIVLLRNPNYAGARPRRAARIVFSDGTPTTEAVKLVAQGKLDYLPPDLNSGPLEPGGEVDRAFGARSAGRQRFFLHNRPYLDTIVFNTRRPLFAQPRLRRAVGFALDRASVARAYFDAPAARIVPAIVPGFDVPGVYPLEHPDLPAARRLAGRVHRRAVLLAPCDASVIPAALLVRKDLAKIGIAVHVEVVNACDTPTVGAKFAHADMVIQTSLGSGPPNRDPVAFIDQALARGGYQGARLGPGPWYGAAFRGRLDRARGLRGAARIRAFRRLDDELARDAPLLVYGAFQYDEFFGARIGCERFQSFYDAVDLGALCARA